MASDAYLEPTEVQASVRSQSVVNIRDMAKLSVREDRIEIFVTS